MITSEKIARRLTKTSVFACLPQNRSGQKNIYCITRYAMPHEMNTNEVGQGEENDEMVELRRCVQTEEWLQMKLQTQGSAVWNECVG